MSFPELRDEWFKEADMIFGQFDLEVPALSFQTEQSLVFKRIPLTAPTPA
jgi:hypothetical protein